jgi:hypothetical protein
MSKFCSGATDYKKSNISLKVKGVQKEKKAGVERLGPAIKNRCVWGALCLLVISSAVLKMPINKEPPPPPTHCHSSLKMKMDPTPEQAKSWGNEAFSGGLIFKVHPQSKGTGIDASDLELKMNQVILENTKLALSLKLSDTLGSYGLFRTSKPVTALQASQIFEALKELCSYTIDDASINWPVESHSDGYELDSSPINVPSHIPPTTYRGIVDEAEKSRLSALTFKKFAKFENKYTTSNDEIHNFQLFEFSDRIGMKKVQGTKNIKETLYFRKGTPRAIEAWALASQVKMGKVKIVVIDDRIYDGPLKNEHLSINRGWYIGLGGFKTGGKLDENSYYTTHDINIQHGMQVTSLIAGKKFALGLAGLGWNQKTDTEDWLTIDHIAREKYVWTTSKGMACAAGLSQDLVSSVHSSPPQWQKTSESNLDCVAHLGTDSAPADIVNMSMGRKIHMANMPDTANRSDICPSIMKDVASAASHRTIFVVSAGNDPTSPSRYSFCPNVIGVGGSTVSSYPSTTMASQVQIERHDRSTTLPEGVTYGIYAPYFWTVLFYPTQGHPPTMQKYIGTYKDTGATSFAAPAVTTALAFGLGVCRGVSGKMNTRMVYKNYTKFLTDTADIFIDEKTGEEVPASSKEIVRPVLNMEGLVRALMRACKPRPGPLPSSGPAIGPRTHEPVAGNGENEEITGAKKVKTDE